MKVQISVSAAPLEPGTRVAVEFDKNDWSIGTILKATPTGYKIDFDYGEMNRLIKTADARIVAVDQKRKLTKSLTYSAVKELKAPAKKSAGLVKKLPVAQKKPAKAAPKKPVPAKPVEPKPAPTPAPKKTEPTSTEERKLSDLVGDHVKYSKCTTSKTARALFFNHVWAKANKQLFGGKLVPPNFRFLKEMTNFRRLGQWNAERRELAISPRLFNALENQCITTIVHEMCHQAVSEIDHVNDRTQGGHGPNWCTWMIKCGLTPSRYNQEDRTSFMDATEKAEHERRQANKQQAHAQAKGEKRRLFSLKPDIPAQYFDADKNVWVKGLIVGENDQAGKRWCFITSPITSSWKVIPCDWFYALEGPDADKYLAPEFIKAAQYIRNYKDTRRDISAQKRRINDKLRDFFN